MQRRQRGRLGGVVTRVDERHAQVQRIEDDVVAQIARDVQPGTGRVRRRHQAVARSPAGRDTVDEAVERARDPQVGRRQAVGQPVGDVTQGHPGRQVADAAQAHRGIVGQRCERVDILQAQQIDDR